MPDLIVRSLGEQPYLETWEAMKAFTADRDDSVADELWCLEHPRVYTQGQAGKAEPVSYTQQTVTTKREGEKAESDG